MDNGQLSKMLFDLNGTVATLVERSMNMEGKIDQVISLQQIANGRTSKNEQGIVELEKWRSHQKGGWKATSVIGSIIGAIMGILAAILFGP